MGFIPIYIFILFFTIVIDYFAGILISISQGKKRKMFLIMSICANVLVLAVFKYYNFFIENINILLDSWHIQRNELAYLSIILPIGLSFHTFQAMSYTIEVYRNKFPAEKHIGYYALYVMFYPQLVAGPIERPQNILPQLRAYHPYNHNRMISGLQLMLWGLFKKVVIADRLGLMTDEVYNHLNQYTGFAYVVSTILFGIQIYCDFSGYSDIAIGSARTMGIDLMINFKRPYFASTISEFWKRWHISLSTWFRDYVYISLGGNRVPILRKNLNLLIVFLLSGFWHGASWNFVVWGGIHGFFLIVANFVHGKFSFFQQKQLYNIFFTFLLVNFAWIFFRASTFQDAMHIISNLFSKKYNSNYFSLLNDDLKGNITYLGFPQWKFIASLLLIPLLFMSDWFIGKGYVINFNRRPLAVKWVIYYLIILTILLLGVFETNQFIYFQF